MHLAEEAVSQASLWGVIGIFVSGVIGLIGLMIQRGRGNGKHTEAPTPEKLAATTASSDILEWLEENVLGPLRTDLSSAQESIAKLQADLAHKSAQLVEAHKLVSDLQAKVVSYEAQIAIMVRQLNGERKRP
jgi:hypothetical protein